MLAAGTISDIYEEVNKYLMKEWVNEIVPAC